MLAMTLFDVGKRCGLAVGPLELEGAIRLRIDLDEPGIEGSEADELRCACDLRQIGLCSTDRRNGARSSDSNEDFVSREHVQPGVA
jgi:hypothetical protein